MRKNRIHFIDNRGRKRSEYVPPANQYHLNWLREKYLYWRIVLDRDIYYWHVRHRIEPKYRKIFDIAFIYHYGAVHGSHSDNWFERRHFWLAWNLYGHEQRFILGELDKVDQNINVKAHPDVKKYFRSWMIDHDPDLIPLFHGMKPYDFDRQLEMVGDSE